MIRLTDPNSSHPFVPECEKDKVNQTTFHVRPMTLRQSVTIAQAARQSLDGGQSIPIDAILELLSENIISVENGTPSGDVDEFLASCSTPEAIGAVFEVFQFIQKLSTPDEVEAGN